MNIEKADYATVVKFGTLADLKMKLSIEKKDIFSIINWKDSKGISILEHSIISRNFVISKYLLNHDAEVNVVSEDGCNEFHYLAPSIDDEGALEIAELLLVKGASLTQKEKKYGNTALFSLCLESLKRRLDNTMLFIQKCLKESINYEEQNNSGISIKQLISERGTSELKMVLEEKYE